MRTGRTLIRAAPARTPAPAIAIGAWANPPGSSGSSAQKIAALEASIGRRFDISLHYDAWAAPFPSAGEADDRVKGRTPEISWECANTDASIAAGAQDAAISAKAAAMAAYGAPILLRYKWEFNDTIASMGRASCDDSVRDRDGYFDPTDFIAAWRHIHALFVAARATNVAFVWNPSGNNHNGAAPYWPGDAVVDWIGVDAYDLSAHGLRATLAAPYAAYAGLGNGAHPMIVGETGGAPADQATYLDASTRAMLAASYPNVRAVTYFDADGPHGAWAFTPAGLSAFASFANP